MTKDKEFIFAELFEGKEFVTASIVQSALSLFDRSNFALFTKPVDNFTVNPDHKKSDGGELEITNFEIQQFFRNLKHRTGRSDVVAIYRRGIESPVMVYGRKKYHKLSAKNMVHDSKLIPLCQRYVVCKRDDIPAEESGKQKYSIFDNISWEYLLTIDEIVQCGVIATRLNNHYQDNKSTEEVLDLLNKNLKYNY